MERSQRLLKVNEESILSRDNIQQDHQSAEYQPHQEKHTQAGQYLKSIIYGGIDGVTGITIIIVSGVASNSHPYQVFSFAVSALIADAVCMGLGDYLSGKAEVDYIAKERERELHEINTLLDQEKQEIIEIYTEVDPRTEQARYSEEDAARVADLYATNKEAFANIMMLEELKLAPEDPDSPKKNGLATCLAFLVFGGIPALPYIIKMGIMKGNSHEWIPSLVLAIIVLFSLGFMKATLIGLNKWKSGLQTLILGSSICAIGYALGLAFDGGS